MKFNVDFVFTKNCNVIMLNVPFILNDNSIHLFSWNVKDKINTHLKLCMFKVMTLLGKLNKKETFTIEVNSNTVIHKITFSVIYHFYFIFDA